MIRPTMSEPTPSETSRESLFGFLLTGKTTILIVLLLLVLVFGITAPGFLSLISISNILVTTSLFLLLALGETFVMISGGIDLSVAAMLALSGMVAGAVLQFHNGTDVGLSIVGFFLAVITGVVGGALNGATIIFLRLNPLIVTLGTYGIFGGLAEIISHGNPVSNFPSFIFTIGNGGPVFPYPVWITFVIVIVFAWVAKRTRFGRYTYAVGANREAVRRSGVNLRLHSVVLYAVAGLAAGLAGFLSLAHFQTASPVAGSSDLLIAVAAVVIGGTPLTGGEGSVWGTVIGALVISVLENGFVMLNVSSFWQLVAVGITTILAVYFDEIQKRARLYRASLHHDA